MARRFNGSSDKIDTGVNAACNPGAGSLTIACWIRTTATGTVIVGKYNGTGNDYWLGLSSGAGVFNLLGTTSGAGAVVNNGAWHHLVGSRDGIDTGVRVYVDGMAPVVGINGASCSPGGNLTFGCYNNQFFWGGDLEDVAYWNQPLTFAEIRALSRGETPLKIRPAALVDYWPLSPYLYGRRNSGTPTNTGTFAVRQRRNAPVPLEDYDADAAAGGGTVTGDGSSAGIGTATGVGGATAAAVAASAGAGVAQATGAATFAGVGNAAGVGEALGVGAFTAGTTETGVGNAAGVGTATAVGAATSAGVATAAGVGEALAVGAAIGIISAVGNAAGSSEALGYSPQLLGGGEAGRGGKGGKRRRKRIEWLPADYDLETGEPLPQPDVPVPALSVKLTKPERKVARLLAQYRSRDDDVAERAREQLEALRAAEDSALARFIARQEALDTQRRAAAAIAAEDDEAVVAFMQWLLKQP